jgi:hypothetical protein
MDAETRAALEASIKHWEENVSAEQAWETSVGPSKCALCALFSAQLTTTENHCGGCPVAEAVGEISCEGTPYLKAVSARIDWLMSPSGGTKRQWREAAQAELDFLISLRPKEED